MSALTSSSSYIRLYLPASPPECSLGGGCEGEITNSKISITNCLSPSITCCRRNLFFAAERSSCPIHIHWQYPNCKRPINVSLGAQELPAPLHSHAEAHQGACWHSRLHDIVLIYISSLPHCNKSIWKPQGAVLSWGGVCVCSDCCTLKLAEAEGQLSFSASQKRCLAL